MAGYHIPMARMAVSGASFQGQECRCCWHVRLQFSPGAGPSLLHIPLFPGSLTTELIWCWERVPSPTMVCRHQDRCVCLVLAFGGLWACALPSLSLLQHTPPWSPCALGPALSPQPGKSHMTCWRAPVLGKEADRHCGGRKILVTKAFV